MEVVHDHARRRHDVRAAVLLRRRQRRDVVTDSLRQEVVRRETSRVDQRRRKWGTQNVMTIEEAVSGVERVVVAVGSFVRERALDVLVRREVRRDQVRVETG